MKGGQPVFWTKICNEALMSITAFMDVFNFDEMLHGTSRSDSSTTIGNKFSQGTLPHKRGIALTSPMRDASVIYSSGVVSPIRQIQTAYEESIAKSPGFGSKYLKEAHSGSWFTKFEKYV